MWLPTVALAKRKRAKPRRSKGFPGGYPRGVKGVYGILMIRRGEMHEKRVNKGGSPASSATPPKGEFIQRAVRIRFLSLDPYHLLRAILAIYLYNLYPWRCVNGPFML